MIKLILLFERMRNYKLSCDRLQVVLQHLQSLMVIIHMYIAFQKELAHRTNLNCKAELFNSIW